MKIQKSLERLRLGTTAALAEGARDLGHELPRNRFDLLADYRAALAELMRQAHPSDYERGFLEALAAVTAAYAAEARPQTELETAARIVESRSGWTKILSTIAAGHHRPSALAATAEIVLPQVSRALVEMENAGLVERHDPAAGEDGRGRPVQLTRLGERVVERLCPSDWRSQVSPPVLMEAIVKALAHVANEGLVPTADFRHQLAALGAASIPAAEKLLEHARERQLLRIVDDVVVSSLQAKERTLVQLTLERANAGQAVPLFEVLKSRSASVELVVVRSEDLRFQWDLALVAMPIPFVTLNSPELNFHDFGGRSYTIVYESNALLGSDLRERPEVAWPFIKNAQSRFCLVAPDGPKPDELESQGSFESIPLAV